VSGQLHAPAAYPQGKSPWYPLDRWLGGPQSRSGHGGEQKNSQPLPRQEPLIAQPVAQRYTAELCWVMPYNAKLMRLLLPANHGQFGILCRTVSWVSPYVQTWLQVSAYCSHMQRNFHNMDDKLKDTVSASLKLWKPDFYLYLGGGG
jgi:hypothetical protein